MLPNSEIREKHVFGSEAMFLYPGHCCYIPAGSPARWASAWSPLGPRQLLSSVPGQGFYVARSSGSVARRSVRVGLAGRHWRNKAEAALSFRRSVQTANRPGQHCVFVETHSECPESKEKVSPNQPTGSGVREELML